MADPNFIDCPADAWVKVASNVISGQIHRRISTTHNYFHTYRTSGGVPPVDRKEGVVMFRHGSTEFIRAVNGIDVYVMSAGVDGKVGVDTP